MAYHRKWLTSLVTVKLRGNLLLQLQPGSIIALSANISIQDIQIPEQIITECRMLGIYMYSESRVHVFERDIASSQSVSNNI